jgi:hypothetical protein
VPRFTGGEAEGERPDSSDRMASRGRAQGADSPPAALSGEQAELAASGSRRGKPATPGETSRKPESGHSSERDETRASAGTSIEAERPEKPKDPEAEMAAELAMAAEIARVLGGAGSGYAPNAADETPGSETPDSGSGAVPSAESSAARAAPPDRSGAARTASFGGGGAAGTASFEGSGAARAISSEESGAAQAPESETGVRPGSGGKPDTSGAAPSAADAGLPRGDGGAAVDGEVAVVPGVARYHRRGCILIRFMGDTDLETMSREVAEQAGLMACRACQPNQA